MTKMIKRIMWFQKIIDLLLKRQKRLQDELCQTISYGWDTTGDIVDDFLIKRNRKYSADLSDQYKDLRDRLRDHCGELLLVVEREHYGDVMTKMRDMAHHCTIYSLAVISRGNYEFHQQSREKLFFGTEGDVYAHAYIYGNDQEVNRWSIGDLECPDLQLMDSMIEVEDSPYGTFREAKEAIATLKRLEIIVGTKEVQNFMHVIGKMNLYSAMYNVLANRDITSPQAQSNILQFSRMQQK